MHKARKALPLINPALILLALSCNHKQEYHEYTTWEGRRLNDEICEINDQGDTLVADSFMASDHVAYILDSVVQLPKLDTFEWTLIRENHFDSSQVSRNLLTSINNPNSINDQEVIMYKVLVGGREVFYLTVLRDFSGNRLAPNFYYWGILDLNKKIIYEIHSLWNDPRLLVYDKEHHHFAFYASNYSWGRIFNDNIDHPRPYIIDKYLLTAEGIAGILLGR